MHVPLQMNCADCFEQSSVKTRIDILYGMYLDCKHIGDFLYKRAQVAEILKRERREQAHVKKVTMPAYIDTEINARGKSAVETARQLVETERQKRGKWAGT